MYYCSEANCVFLFIMQDDHEFVMRAVKSVINYKLIMLIIIVFIIKFNDSAI